MFSFISIINCKIYFHIKIYGALGQTRTGTPKRARILSPLCLPISPRGLCSSLKKPFLIYNTTKVNYIIDK